MPPKFSYEDTSAYLYIHPAMTLRRPPCQAACPAGTPISLMNKLLADDRKEEALAVLLDITPFPGSMCESCAKPCESACNKRQHTSKPVPIARLAQLAASCLPDANPPCGEPTGYTVAVIGTNVEALTMAYFLYRLGHTITVMGDASVDGGSGLPERGVKQYLADHGVAFCPRLLRYRPLSVSTISLWWKMKPNLLRARKSVLSLKRRTTPWPGFRKSDSRPAKWTVVCMDASSRTLHGFVSLLME